MTDLAAAMFDAPIALITVLETDRQWFRSNRGFAGDHTTRDESFCAHAVELGNDGVFVVPDAMADARFKANRLVVEEGVRFYAGAVITTPDNRHDGAVCVIDTKPRPPLTEQQTECLRLLARMAAVEIELARKAHLQSQQVETLKLAETMAGVGNWRLDVQSGQVVWSDEVYRIHGFAPGGVDPTLHSAVGAYHSEDQAEISRLVARAVEHGEGYEARLRLYRADGEERITRSRALASQDDHGETTTLYGVFQDVTEHEADRQRLADSEAMFRLMSESAIDIIARYRPDGTFLYLSPSVETVLGRRPEDLVGRNCADIIHSDDVAQTFTAMARYVAVGPTATTPHIEYRAVKADGSIVWLEASPRAVFDATGAVIEVQDHVRDVTARKIAQTQQSELVQTLKLAEAMAGVGNWRYDLDTGVVTWSDEVYRIHGLDPLTTDPTLHAALGSYHPDDRATIVELVDRARRTGEGYDSRIRLQRSDGEWRTTIAKARCELGPDGRPRTLVGVFQDITDQERTLARIQDSEARYRLLADHANDMIAQMKPGGEIIFVTPGCQRVLGFSADELVGQRTIDLMHPDDLSVVADYFARLAALGPGGVLEPYQFRGRHKTGHYVWLEGQPRIFFDDRTGEQVRVQDVVRDVSCRKQLEFDLHEARLHAEEATRAKSEFLANMSHELRTPLTSVIGFSGLLNASTTLSDRERLFATRIGTASDALLSVINDILDYSKLEAGSVEIEPLPFELSALVEGTASLLETQLEKKGLALTLDLPPSLPTLVGDAARLRQILLNLLSNAMKFTAAGSVHVAVSATRRPDDLLELRISVRDTGIGISPGRIDELFERFTQADASTTRNYGGTGLGLAISKRLVTLMGGDMGADSQPGRGSEFWFTVPVALAIQDRSSSPRLSSEFGGARILVADDLAENRELLIHLLSEGGLAVEAVSDGAEAVAAMATGAFDLILMDVQMPGMDGLTATRAIRDLPCSVPILAVTANIQPAHVRRCLEAGMNGHLAKPIDRTVLFQALGHWLLPGEDHIEASLSCPVRS